MKFRLSNISLKGRIRTTKEPSTFLLLLSLFVLLGLTLVFVRAAPNSSFAPLFFLPILLFGAVFGFRGATFSTMIIVVGASTIFDGFLELLSPVPTSLTVDQILGLIMFGAAISVLFDHASRSTSEDSSDVLRATSSDPGISGIYIKVLASLAKMIEVRDYQMKGHCRRVADNALIVARAMGLSDTQFDTIFWGAMLHDLGKIAIPEYILAKHGRLTDEEFREIKRHPDYGADLLTSISSDFFKIAEVIRTHHERWDGYGYPFGLRGEEIPLPARIISIVDVFEALTSDRPYRRPLAPEAAIRNIRNGAGTQFDPEIVPLFESLFIQGYLQHLKGTNETSGAIENEDSVPISAPTLS